jgi:hypothetical protein
VVPVALNVTDVEAAVVLLLLAGAEIVRAGLTPRLTVTDLLSEPNALVQATVMVFAPTERLTVAGLVAAAPLTVQEVGGVPVVVHVAEVDVAVVFELSVGAVIVTTGAVPWLTVTDFVSDAEVESPHETVMTFAPGERLTVAGLVAEAPLTVQLIGATPPVVVHVTEVVAAVVLLLLAGAVIVTARPEPRVTLTVLVSAPNELEQATVMVFAPIARLTVAGLVAAEPLTVQETGAVPVEVQTTEVEVELVVLPLAGAEIVTTGAMPRVFVIELVDVPNALVQDTEMVFAPTARLTVAGLVAAAPLTVQVTGAVPVDVHETEVVAAVVLTPSVGAVIVTDGAMPRLTVMVFVFDPTELVQTTVMVFAPIARLTLAGLDAAAPLTVQVGAGDPVALNETGIEEAVVFVPFAGLVIVVTGAWLVHVVEYVLVLLTV